MRYLGLLMLLTLASLLTYGQQSVVIYYNGTVVAHLNNVSTFHVIGDNITDLRVIGSKFNHTGGYLFFYNTSRVTVIYVASFPKGVIQGTEPYNVTFNVIVPGTYTFAYIYPPPTSLETRGNLYNLTLQGSSLEVLYSTSSQSSSGFGKEDLIILVVVLVTDAVVGFFLYEYFRSRRRPVTEQVNQNQQMSQAQASQTVEEDEKEEEAELTTQELNDRDIMVLESFKRGARTLSDAVRDTGLPKSTVYRRIKKLVKLGYLVERREGGKIWYEVSQPPPDKPT
ncbi:MAG: winged helix-turn-helix domain-containing protein [Metallosphaera prunae]|uniref:helix-turn-helix transcriptional regulator n=1 Tax=Metallosphaera prunae TaxID=47304 RepID=UPI002272E378|nr:winged helix-turn-helix domain-containing protein [Metallosphaera prunae]MCY0860942.1 winged helix-turn-helix domain-containing protein [Metallosphaera prunae]